MKRQEQPARRRIIFLDPSLGRGGHHAVVAANYARLLTDSCGELVFAGNRRAERDWSSGLEVVPAFSYVVEDSFRVTLHGLAWLSNPNAVRLARAALRLHGRLRRRLARGDSGPRPGRPLDATACRALVAPLGAGASLDALQSRLGLTGLDTVVALSADPALMAALLERPAWRANLHVVFMYPEDAIFGSSTREGFVAMYRELAVHAQLYAESPDHAEALRALLGREVAALTTPTWLDPLPPPEGAFTVAALGAARADKGFLLLPEIVAEVRSLADDITFLLQGPERGAGLDAAASRLAREPSVKLQPARVLHDAYASALRAAHVLLLPYDSQLFANRGSGVVVDSLVAGRPCIATAGTSMARLAGDAGRAASGAEGFAAAILAMREDYPRYLAAAQRRSGDLRLRISESPLIAALRDSLDRRINV